MSQTYWDKTHKEKYSKSPWASRPSLFAETAVKYFPLRGKLLDIGTGQGQDSVYFSNRGYAVTAIDFSDTALESAKRKTTNTEFIKADISQGLPFEDDSFDIVFSHLALHYFDSLTTKRIFTDIHRILKPGGIFATLTNTIQDPEISEAGYVEIEPGLYKTPDGILKRYFSTNSIKAVTDHLFTPLLLDAQGETYKDEIKILIRFIGKAI